MDSMAPQRTSIEPGEIGFGPRFVQKDQPGRIQTRLSFLPKPPCPGDVRTFLLAGMECLFLYVKPIFPKTTLIACNEHFSPLAPRNSLSVRSFFLVSNARIWLRWRAKIIGLRPEK